MEKSAFKAVSGIQVIANLVSSIYIIVLVSGVILIIKPTLTFLSLFLGMSILYLILMIFSIYISRKLRYIKFQGTSKEIVRTVYKYSYWFFFPLIFSLTLQKLREAMWDHYSQSKTKDLTKQSDIVKEHVKLLDELRDDDFISRYYYEKHKPRLEEHVQKLLEIEAETMKNEVRERKQKSKMTAVQIEDAKWE